MVTLASSHHVVVELTYVIISILSLQGRVQVSSIANNVYSYVYKTQHVTVHTYTLIQPFCNI